MLPFFLLLALATEDAWGGATDGTMPAGARLAVPGACLNCSWCSWRVCVAPGAFWKASCVWRVGAWPWGVGMGPCGPPAPVSWMNWPAGMLVPAPPLPPFPTVMEVSADIC